jgi:hypothetical protein
MKSFVLLDEDKLNILKQYNLLLEQDDALASPIGLPKKATQEVAQVEPYPSYCKYQNYLANSNKLKDENITKALENMRCCVYTQPSNVHSGAKKTIIISNYLNLTFFTEDDYAKLAEKHLKNDSVYTWNFSILKNGKSYPKYSEEDFKKMFRTLFPINTVKSIGTYSANYRTNLKTGAISFNGYFSKKKNEYYIPPKLEDTRTEYQRFIDVYGDYIQWGGIIISIIATGGANVQGWLLIADILVQLGLALPVTIRDIQKGHNISAVFSILMGLMPILDFSKIYRGIDLEAFKSIVQKLKNENISPDNILQFYNNLNDEEKKSFAIIFTQDNFNIFKNQIAKISGKQYEAIFSKQIMDKIKDNPDVLNNINFWRNAFKKDISIYVSSFLFYSYLELFFPKLNDEDKNKIFKLVYNDEEKLKKLLEYATLDPRKSDQGFFELIKILNKNNINN